VTWRKAGHSWRCSRLFSAVYYRAALQASVRVIEETPAYWRVVFDYPPLNTVDATMFDGLQDLLARMDSSQGPRVIVFESTWYDHKSCGDPKQRL
jgi:vancomycin resistance protein YoaR